MASLCRLCLSANKLPYRSTQPPPSPAHVMAVMGRQEGLAYLAV